jgi:hypothetical protein
MIDTTQLLDKVHCVVAAGPVVKDGTYFGPHRAVLRYLRNQVQPWTVHTQLMSSVSTFTNGSYYRDERDAIDGFCKRILQLQGVVNEY